MAEAVKPNFRVMDRIRDTTLMEKLWALYQTVYKGQSVACAQNQLCYSRSSFMSTLRDEQYVKFILFVGDDPIGFMLATNNLEHARVAYVNPERLRHVFAKFLPDKVYYFTFLGIDPRYQERGIFYALIHPAMLYITYRGGIFVFDFSHETKAAHLAEMFRRISQDLCAKDIMPHRLRYVCVGKQEFGAVVPEHETFPKIETERNVVHIRERYQKTDSWGMSANIDLFWCNGDLIRSREKIQEFVRRLCDDLLHVQRVGECMIIDLGQKPHLVGFSMIQFIETSSITGHFADQTNSAYLDVFSCAFFDPYAVHDFARSFFEARESSMRHVLREKAR